MTNQKNFQRRLFRDKQFGDKVGNAFKVQMQKLGARHFKNSSKPRG
jgi:hypothetical protein